MNVSQMGPAEKMASVRTTLGFQRTRMAADRTMMAILRTALSLIGFGFTIFSFFSTLISKQLLGDALPSHAPGRFGLALVALGVVMLTLGIVGDIRFARALRRQRQGLIEEGLVAEDRFPRSLTLATAFLLLLLGLFAILSITLRAGPLGG